MKQENIKKQIEVLNNLIKLYPEKEIVFMSAGIFSDDENMYYNEQKIKVEHDFYLKLFFYFIIE